MTANTMVRPKVDHLDEDEIKGRLTAILAELDEIGVTLGMNQQRVALRAERDELLDALLRLFAQR
jgi:hypothetical protein